MLADRFLTCDIPEAGPAAIELDARVLAECSLANVLQLTDSPRGRNKIDVVTEAKTASPSRNCALAAARAGC